MTETARPWEPDEHVEVRIHPWSKFVYFYPTFIMSLVMCGVTFLVDPGSDVVLGFTWFFLLVLSLNCLAVGTDFPTSTTVIATILIGLALFGLAMTDLYLQWGGFLGAISLVQQVRPEANRDFFAMLALMLGLILAVVAVQSRLTYWVVMPNRIEHHRRINEATLSLPTAGASVDKRIPDAFEHWLFNSGRLIITPEGEKDIVLDNVRNIDETGRQISKLLEAANMHVTDPASHDH